MAQTTIDLFTNNRSTSIRQISGRLISGLREASGSVAILFGLLAMVMLLMMGAAVDYGRWLHARSESLKAIDAAVLAAGRALQINPADTTAALALADRYYQENVRSRFELLSDTITFKTDDNATSVTAQGSAYLKTSLLNLAGIDKLSLFDLSGAEFSKAVLAVGGNAGTNLEIALMLDTSGSMGANQKFKDMQEAATDLINIVVWADQSSYTSKVALAPFSSDMRVPAAILDTVRGSNLPSSVTKSYSCGKSHVTCTSTYHLTPCVAERTGAENFSGAGPGPGHYVTAVYSRWGTCSQPEENAMAPLSNDKSALIAKVDGLEIAGSTAGHLGTAWAWYALSPEWNSVWPESAAAAYGAEKTQKIAILMTDGEYNTEYDAQGVKVGATGSGEPPNGDSITQARALCDGMKAKGITVYTIGFDLGGNETAIDTLRYCTTDASKHYNAEDGAELKQAFRDIALKLSTLYLSR